MQPLALCPDIWPTMTCHLGSFVRISGRHYLASYVDALQNILFNFPTLEPHQIKKFQKRNGSIQDLSPCFHSPMGRTKGHVLGFAVKSSHSGCALTWHLVPQTDSLHWIFGFSCNTLLLYKINTIDLTLFLQPFAELMAVPMDFYQIRKWTTSDQIVHMLAWTVFGTTETHTFCKETT